MSELADYLSDSHPVMWVSKSRKLIYLKNPKTGSRSMLSKLQEMCGDMRAKRFKLGRLKGSVGDWLKTVDDKELSQYWIFTVARNPWDRVVSCYFYIKDVEKLVDMSFDEFVEGIVSGAHSQKVMDHLVHQHKYFMLGGRVFADYVGRFEHMGLACKRIKQACGHWDGDLPKTNTSEHKPFHEYYTEKTAKMIAEHYERDISLLNYDFPISSWVDVENDWVKISKLAL